MILIGVLSFLCVIELALIVVQVRNARTFRTRMMNLTIQVNALHREMRPHD